MSALPDDRPDVQTRLRIDTIRLDGGTQIRVGLSEADVLEYADAYSAGGPEHDALPPVIVYYDGEHRWLADGYHRIEAAKRARRLTIAVDLRPGTRRDAVLHAAGANATHGRRRTREDLHRAIDLLVADDEWSRWSDRRIADVVGCSPTTVGKRRPREVSNLDTSRVGRDGKAYPAAPAPSSAPTPEPPALADAREAASKLELGGAYPPATVRMRWQIEANERITDERWVAALDAGLQAGVWCRDGQGRLWLDAGPAGLETADTLDLPPDDPAHAAARLIAPGPATVTALVRVAADALRDAGAWSCRAALATRALRQRVEAEAGPVSASAWAAVLTAGERGCRWVGDGSGVVWLPEESLSEPGADLDLEDEGDEEEESPAYTAVPESPAPPTTVRRRAAPEPAPPPPAMPPDNLPNDERAPFDAYYTPEAHTRAAVRWLMLQLDGWVPGNLAAVEPSVGAGAWARALASARPGASCDVVDINPLAPGLAEAAQSRAHCADWLRGPEEIPHGRWRDRLAEAAAHDPWDLCLGNPPYDREIVVPFIERCLQRARITALLMRGTFPGSLGRREFWRAHRPAYIVNVSPRPLWEGPGARDATDSMDPVLIVWVRGWDDPHTRYEWLYLDDEAQP